MYLWIGSGCLVCLLLGSKNSVDSSSLDEIGTMPYGFQQPWSGLGDKYSNDFHSPSDQNGESTEEDFEVFLKKVNLGMTG